MQLFSLEGNRQRLDGGAMFGNCPKSLWRQWMTPDEENRIELACRCLLVREAQGRLVLLETGIGCFFSPKLRARFGVDGSEHRLIASLAAIGVQPGDIDVIVLSHLHFDHAGGALSAWADGVRPQLAFPRATFVVGAEAWARACAPHPRDRASFIPELTERLSSSKRLVVVDAAAQTCDVLGPHYRLEYSHGHTPGLMLTHVLSTQGTMIFVSDLMPGTAWVHAPMTMGYDRFPELLIDEKQRLLDAASREGSRLFFTHDPVVASARIHKGPDGRFRPIDLCERHDGNMRDAAPYT